MFAQKRSKPGQCTQFDAQRFLASEVNTAERPRPYCQRTSSGSSRSASESCPTWAAPGSARSPCSGGARLHAHALQNLRLLHHLRV